MPRILSLSSVDLLVNRTDPPSLVIRVQGTTGTPGWKNIRLEPLEKTLSADGIMDFEVVGDAPDGIVIQVLSPVMADEVWTKDVEKIIGVAVHSRTNALTQLVNSHPVPAPLPFGGALPDFAARFGGEPVGSGQVTTLALGEEGGGKLPLFDTSFAIGEEGSIPLQWGETPPLSVPVEMRVDLGKMPPQDVTDPRLDNFKPPIADIATSAAGDLRFGGDGVTDPPPPDFFRMHALPFGRR